jgi:hypothetical protein
MHFLRVPILEIANQYELHQLSLGLSVQGKSSQPPTTGKTQKLEMTKNNFSCYDFSL